MLLSGADSNSPPGRLSRSVLSSQFRSGYGASDGVSQTDQQASKPLCWALVGPTACGKSAIAFELARRHPVEIVSVDSMQVYRGMDIGTAKPTMQERALVPHQMIDVLDPDQTCNVGWFSRVALRVIKGIQARGKRPFLVGGSALYLKGIIWGLMEGPSCDQGLRRRLCREAEKHGGHALHRRLTRVDPRAARRIHPNDVKRLVRALEVHELTGSPISARQDQFEGPPRLGDRMVGLRWPRALLYDRIDRRVDRMMEAGLLEEVAGLRDRLGAQARQALGYKQLLAYLDGRIGLDEAVRRIKRDTRRFAKHQLTWLRRFPQAHWIDVAEHDGLSEVARRCEKALLVAA